MLYEYMFGFPFSVMGQQGQYGCPCRQMAQLFASIVTFGTVNRNSLP